VTTSNAGSATEATVDVVIPVYNAVDDLERCVESVLEHTDRRYRLVLIDDASPDPAVALYFDALARRRMSHVVLLRNRRNRGFPQTANRGMLLSRADVVLLNSDTVVTRDWLSALARSAASSPSIGTVNISLKREYAVRGELKLIRLPSGVHPRTVSPAGCHVRRLGTPPDGRLAARIASYELAARMQLSVPEIADLSDLIIGGDAQRCRAPRLVPSGARVRPG